jgi:hypothetical protein
LAYHLYRAGNSTTLYQLLTHRSDTKRLTWWSAKESTGDIVGYLDDILLGKRAAKERYDPKHPLDDGDQIGLQVGYVLLQIQLNSVAATMTSGLIWRLVEKGVWTGNQGLGYAQQIPDTTDRSSALIGILPFVPSDLVEEVYENLIVSLDHIADVEMRAALQRALAFQLMAIGRYSDAVQTARAIDTADDISKYQFSFDLHRDRNDYRSDALQTVANQLAALGELPLALEAASETDYPTVEGVLRRFPRTVLEIPEVSQLTLRMQKDLNASSGKQNAERLREHVSVLVSLTQTLPSRCLVGSDHPAPNRIRLPIEWLPEPQSTTVFIARPIGRHTVLTRQPRPVIALSTIDKLKALSELEQGRVSRELYTKLAKMKNQDTKRRAFAQLAPFLEITVLNQIVRRSYQRLKQNDFEALLACLIPHIAEQGDPLTANELVQRISEQETRIGVLKHISVFLPDAQRHDCVDRLFDQGYVHSPMFFIQHGHLEQANSLLSRVDARQLPTTVRNIASWLIKQEKFEDALAFAKTTNDHEYQAIAYAGLGQTEAALQHINEYPNPAKRLSVLLDILPHCTTQERAGMIPQINDCAAASQGCLADEWINVVAYLNFLLDLPIIKTLSSKKRQTNLLDGMSALARSLIECCAIPLRLKCLQAWLGLECLPDNPGILITDAASFPSGRAPYDFRNGEAAELIRLGQYDEGIRRLETYSNSEKKADTIQDMLHYSMDMDCALEIFDCAKNIRAIKARKRAFLALQEIRDHDMQTEILDFLWRTNSAIRTSDGNIRNWALEEILRATRKMIPAVAWECLKKHVRYDALKSDVALYEAFVSRVVLTGADDLYPTFLNLLDTLSSLPLNIFTAYFKPTIPALARLGGLKAVKRTVIALEATLD